MKWPPPLHSWSLSPQEARALQTQLAGQIRVEPLKRWPELVAGLDAALSPDGRHVVGAAVLWNLRKHRVVEQSVARRRLRFPYVPGLLSFREAPVLLAALHRLRQLPDLLLCDGQGVAHPRRFGLACHVGLLGRLPAIGCAKSLLIGNATDPGPERGAWTPLWHGREIVGATLRTRAGSKPVFVSVGHACDLASAIQVVLACCQGHRLPEPIHLADRLSRKARIRSPARAGPGP